MPLNAKQQRFIAEYLIDLNATEAAIRAGYSKKTAYSIGQENLTKPEIASAVATAKAEQLNSAGLTASRVLEELRRLAFQDPRNLWDAQGNLKPLHELTDAQAAAVAGVEVIIKNAEAGDGKTDRVHKIKMWDKPKALEMLAKHFSLLTDVLHVSGDADVIAKLQAARKRVGK